MNQTNKMLRIGLYCLLSAIALLFLLPIVWMLIVSVKPASAPTLEIKEWFNFSNLTLENFQRILSNTQFTPVQWMMNSLIIASVSTLLILFLPSPPMVFHTFPFEGFWCWSLWQIDGFR